MSNWQVFFSNYGSIIAGFFAAAGVVIGVFRRGVSTVIGAGVPSFQFNEINDLKGSRRRRWEAFFPQHSHAGSRQTAPRRPSYPWLRAGSGNLDRAISGVSA